MSKFPKELEVGYWNGQEMKLWKGLAIYPKEIEEKPLNQFTKEERENLTRKGFRWRVYFSFYNPHAGKKGKFEKHLVPTYGMNKDFPKFEERYKAAHRLLNSTKKLLEDGYNPLEVEVPDDDIFTIEKALDLALANKKSKVSIDTYKSYEIRTNQLKEFLKKRKALDTDTRFFNFRLIRDFLNRVAKDTTMANRNNVLRALKAIFSDMYKNEYIKENYLKRIDIEKTVNNRFKSYSIKQAREILEHLEKHDPVLAIFVKFIGFNFLRPVEIVRLKVKDLNMEEKTLQVLVKQGKVKTKRIPDQIIEDLSRYDLSEGDNFLFGLSGISQKWKRGEKGREEHFSTRYRKIIRSLGYGEGYVLYSNRHTYITIGYRNLRKRMSKEKALDTLMAYTGHDTREAIKKYIHHVDAEIVDEYKGLIE